jgi:dihydrofolate reductase
MTTNNRKVVCDRSMSLEGFIRGSNAFGDARCPVFALLAVSTHGEVLIGFSGLRLAFNGGTNGGKTTMRKLIVEAEVSFDGVMGGEMEFWKQIYPFHSADVQEYLNDLLFMPDALLMGRKTYEGFAQVWPTRQGKEADRINSMPKYVTSRTLQEPLQWNASLIQGDVASEIRKLKQEPGKGLLQYGVGELTQTMLQAGLIDEFRILVFPFTFGEGPRIFEQMGVTTLKLLNTKTFSSGVVALHYQPQKPA